LKNLPKSINHSSRTQNVLLVRGLETKIWHVCLVYALLLSSLISKIRLHKWASHCCTMYFSITYTTKTFTNFFCGHAPNDFVRWDIRRNYCTGGDNGPFTDDNAAHNY